MPMYDYVCTSCNLEFETLNKIATRLTTQCPECNSEAIMQIATPNIKLDGTTGDFPGAYAKWERVRKEKLKQEQKASYAGE